MKPKTPQEIAAFRCQSACAIGRDILEEQIEPIGSPLRFESAFFQLLRAVEDLSKQVALIGGTT